MSASGPTKPTPEDPTLAPWNPLRDALAGSFSAGAKGLLGSEFALLGRDGWRFGSLRLRGPEGADLEAGDLRVEIRSAPRPAMRHAMRYATPAEEAPFLIAGAADPSSALEITCGGRRYEARFGLLRNAAVARPLVDAGEPAGEAARLTGGLTNRAYEATFDPEDAGALPLAVFLLYRTVSLRRRAYRADTRT